MPAFEEDKDRKDKFFGLTQDILDGQKKELLKKLFAALFGVHVLIWLFHAAGVTWWWKSLPYCISSIILVLGLCIQTHRIERLDRLQRLILSGFIAAIFLTICSLFFASTVSLAFPVTGIYIRRSLWNSTDQLFTLIILACSFFTSASITRYVSYGRIWMGFGVLAAIFIYGFTRIFSEKFLGKEIIGVAEDVSFSNKNAFGHLLNIGFVFSLVVTLTKSHEKTDWREKISAFLFCLMFGALITINDSRGGLASVATSIAFIIFFFVFKKRNKSKRLKQTIATVVALALASSGAFLAPEFLKRFDTNPLSDYRFRYVVWGESIRQLQELWLSGCGLQCFKYHFNSSPVTLPESIVTHAENSFLTVAYEQGGLILLLLAAFLILHCFMSVSQINRSWRAAMIGVAILSLILSHGMYETLARFSALNIMAVIFLGMLHGHRAWKGDLKKLKSLPLLRPAFAALLGCTFSWGIFGYSSHQKFLNAYSSVNSGDTDDLAWKKTKEYLRLTWDEFEKTSELTYAWRQRARKSGIIEDNLLQKIADISSEQLLRQPADPLAWLSLAFAQAASTNLLDKYDPLNTTHLVPYLIYNMTDSLSRNKFLQNLMSGSNIEFKQIYKSANFERQTAISKSPLLDISATSGIIPPGQVFPEENSYPFLNDHELINNVKEELTIKNLFKNLFSLERREPVIFSQSVIDDSIFVQTWVAKSLPELDDLYRQTNKTTTNIQSAQSFSKANAIYPSILSFYKEALGILSIYRPDLLQEYYNLLNHKQQEKLWAAWHRFLVYDPAMRSETLLKWISSSTAASELRLQALRMLTDLEPQQKIQALRSIFSDSSSQIQVRLDAANVLESIVGPEVWERDVPSDILNSFEVASKRLISAFNSGKDNLLKYVDQLPEPSDRADKRLIIQTAETLEKIGNTAKALQIYRSAVEWSKPAHDARFRNTEIRRRISESGVEEITYLGRLSVLVRSEDAQPEEILDYLNLLLSLDLHVGAREFLESKNLPQLKPEHHDELNYYAAKIAARDRQTDREIELNKQILSRL